MRRHPARALGRLAAAAVFLTAGLAEAQNQARDDAPTDAQPKASEAAPQAAPQVAPRADQARYRVEARFAWSADTHPRDFPPGGHMTTIVAVAHNARYSLFADGDTASSGLALVATNGRPAVLEAELAEAMRRKRVSSIVKADPPATGVGVAAFEIQASRGHPLISFATMLGPSPDWFTGIAAISLLDDDGAWRAEATAPLWVWDAGVDLGETYTARNAPGQPRQSVRLSTAPYFLGPDGVRGVGRAVLTRLDPPSGR